MDQTKTGGQVLVDCLLAQGVDTAFGVPGESYLALLDALHDVPDRIRLVPNRQEGGAAFMAAAWGKLTGRPGIALVTRGPGATNAAIGVHTARQDSSPMILFVGQVDTAMRGREAFQEIDYGAAFGPLAKWATEIDAADRIPEIVARAFATALTGRPGPVVVAIPEDMLRSLTKAAAGPRVTIVRPAPDPEVVAEIGRRLQAAELPLLLVSGSGWSPAGRHALRTFAERHAMPVVADFRCQDLLDNASPAYVGDAGLGKAPHVRELLLEADLILALGTTFGEILSDGYSLFGIPRMRAQLIHVHAAADELNRLHTADLPVNAHPEQLVENLANLSLQPKVGWEKRLETARSAYLASLEAPPQPGELDMGEVARHLRAVLPTDTIVSNGAGNFSTWANKHLCFVEDMRLLGPQSGAMGYGLPAAIAAKIAHPERTVICFTGDGDFQMTCQELGCALQTGACPIVLVVNNGSYGTIRMHQERAYPGRVSFTDIVNPDFLGLARAYGFHAERVTATSQFPAAFARARAATNGALLELVIDVESLTPRQTLSAIRAAAEGKG